jgi:hypothetical protein
VRSAVYNIHYMTGDEASHWTLDCYQSVTCVAARDAPQREDRGR